MSKATMEIKSNNNHQSKNDLISDEKTVRISSSYWLAFGLVVVVTIGAYGAAIITTLVLTIGNGYGNTGDADPVVGEELRKSR